MKKVTIEAGIAYYYNPEKQQKEIIGVPQVVDRNRQSGGRSCIPGCRNPRRKIYLIITQVYYRIPKAGGLEKSRSPVLFIQNKNCIPKVDKYLIYW